MVFSSITYIIQSTIVNNSWFQQVYYQNLLQPCLFSYTLSVTLYNFYSCSHFDFDQSPRTYPPPAQRTSATPKPTSLRPPATSHPPPSSQMRTHPTVLQVPANNNNPPLQVAECHNNNPQLQVAASHNNNNHPPLLQLCHRRPCHQQQQQQTLRRLPSTRSCRHGRVSRRGTATPSNRPRMRDLNWSGDLLQCK